MTAYYVSNTGSDANTGLSEGAAFATPGYAASIATAAGDIIYIKADGDYNFTTATVNASGGFIKLSPRVGMEGYGTVVGDNAIATINNNGFSQGTSGSIAMITYNAPSSDLDPPTYFKNIKLHGYSDGSTEVFALVYGLSGNDEGYIFSNCEFHYGKLAVIAPSNSLGYRVYDSYFYNANSVDVHSAIGCFFEQSQVSADIIQYCIGKNIGNLWDLPTSTNLTGLSASESISDCIVWNSTGWMETGHKPFGSSFRFRQGSDISNCIVWSEGRLPYWDTSNGEGLLPMQNIAYGNMTNAFSANQFGSDLPIEEAIHKNIIEITVDPFVDAANNDFRLNTDANGGAILRANNFRLTDTITDVYPFRQYVSDSFGGGGTVNLHPLRENR